MPMMIWHEPEIVSPWVGMEVLVKDRHQPADLREMVNDLMHQPSWAGITDATTI